MAQGFGHSTYLGWGQEVTYGTGVARTKFIEIETDGIKGERKNIVKPLLGHVSQRRTVKEVMDVTGSFKAPLLWENMEQLLKHAFGTVNTTGTNPYTHTFTLAAALPTGLSIEMNRDDANVSGSAAFLYVGCMIDKLTLTQEMGMTLDCEFEIVGRDRSNVAATSVSLPTYDAVDYAQMTVANLDHGGTPIALPIRKWKLVIDNNLFKDKYRLTGTGLRAGTGRGGQRKVSFEMEVEFESLDVYSKYSGLLTDDLQFTWVNGSKSLSINAPKCTFDGEDPNAGDPGPIYMTVTSTALANAADGDELSLVLINTVSSVG